MYATIYIFDMYTFIILNLIILSYAIINVITLHHLLHEHSGQNSWCAVLFYANSRSNKLTSTARSASYYRGDLRRVTVL